MSGAAVVRAEQRRMAFLALAASLWALGSAVLGVSEAFAYLTPALLIFALVASGRYPGERAFASRIVHRRVTRPRRAARTLRRRLPLRELPRGGALLAAGLAGRSPPPALP